jgi:hypothetical protein
MDNIDPVQSSQILPNNGQERQIVRRATSRWVDAASILALMVLSLAIHVWLIRHTEVAARDSIGFIRYAWELEHQPWEKVLRHSHQHPGYPVALLAVSGVVRHFVSGPEVRVFQLSAQLTSLLAGMLIIIPMYLLGSRLIDRKTGLWAAALFQCLPLSSRLMADGLSEATFLLFVATALYFGVVALQGTSRAWYALCGLFGALAYLTRPEGALVVAAVVLVLLGASMFEFSRRSWEKSFRCGAALLGTALVVASPYYLTIGGFTTKPTAIIMLGAPNDEIGTPVSRLVPIGAELAASEPRREAKTSSTVVLAAFAPESPHDRNWWAIKALVTELCRGFQYFAFLPALMGLWIFRHRMRESAAPWLLVVFCLLQGAVLWKLARVMGYLSERHIVGLLLCGVFLAAGAIPFVADWLTQTVSRIRYGGLVRSNPERARGWLTAGLLVALTFSSLPETLKRLHANRSGHRSAGLWLAQHSSPADPVTDPFCWAHYYAGKVFLEGTNPAVPPGHVPTRYVVMDDREHTRLPLMPQAKQYAEKGKLVYHWPENKPLENATVFVYAVPATP